MLIVVALAITCLLAALAMSIACAIMYVTPDYWSAWVEKENRFWVRKGLLSPASAERLARFEQSDYLKIIYLVGAPLCALAGAVALFLVL